MPACHEAEHLYLGSLSPPAMETRRRVSGRLQDRSHRFGVEPALRGFETQLFGGSLWCEGRPVCSFLGHGLVRIGGSEQAGAVGIVAAVAWRW